MCIFGSNKGAKAAQQEADRAREQEEARQAEIRTGRDNINAVFDGGVYNPAGADYTPQAGNTYYRANGVEFKLPAPGDEPVPFSPMSVQGPLYKSKSKGIATDEYFAKNRQAFMDYATPQLDEQFGEASNELTFDLARSGLRNSSVRGEQTGKLQKLYDRNMQQITNEALSREQQQRNAVESARSNLISMLQTTGDAQGTTNQALSRASALSMPEPFQPLGQLFTDFTAGLGTQAAMERAGSMSNGRFKPRYDTGLFGTPRDAVRNTR